MRFDVVVERLASLPVPLPEGAPELIPVLQGIDLWSQRAELATINEGLPWTDLLAGMTRMP